MIGNNESRALPEDDRLLLHAYLDEELDVRAVLELERRIASDARLKAEYDRLEALRAVLALKVSKDVASDALRKRIARIASPVVPIRRFHERRFDWRAVAASTAVAACFASAATFLVVTPDPTSRSLEAIVAGHQRALLAAQPVDVASSDRHTVKPWFDSKLALSPRVIDLAADGFPLVGGRVEIVDGKPVPTLVYRHREHLVSVVAVPKAGGRDDGGAPARETRDGYTVLTWPGADFIYSAVSDVAVDELEGFISRFREASKSM
jgi:anti-sigma factor RsiW